MNNKSKKKPFLTALKKYEDEGRIYVMECDSNCSNIYEYIGAVKSGKSIYFAFINNDTDNIVEESDLSKFRERAEKLFCLGGIAFVILCLNNKTYRIPYFVLDPIIKNGCTSISESEISRFEFESNEIIVPFLENDVFECTIAGKSFFIN